MGKRVPVKVKKPLMNENFEQLPAAKKVAEKLSDESKEFDVVIYIDSVEMSYTALALSMSKRPNVDCHAYIGEFPGNHFVYSYLAGSHFTTVKFSGVDVSNG